MVGHAVFLRLAVHGATCRPEEQLLPEGHAHALCECLVGHAAQGDELTAGRHDAHLLFSLVAAEGVEHVVDTAEGFSVVFGLVVDEAVSAKTQHALLTGGATVSDDGQALCLCQGNCHGTHTAGTAGDEDGLAGLGAHQVECLHDGQGGQGNARRFFVAEVFGYASQSGRIHGYVFCESANAVQRQAGEDALADFEGGDAFTEGFYAADDFVACDLGQGVGGDELDFTAGNHVVEGVDACGADLDEYLLCGGAGCGYVSDGEGDVVLVVRNDLCCLHGGPFGCGVIR